MQMSSCKLDLFGSSISLPGSGTKGKYQYLSDLQEVFDRFSASGHKLSPAKCKFAHTLLIVCFYAMTFQKTVSAHLRIVSKQSLSIQCQFVWKEEHKLA